MFPQKPRAQTRLGKLTGQKAFGELLFQELELPPAVELIQEWILDVYHAFRLPLGITVTVRNISQSK